MKCAQNGWPFHWTILSVTNPRLPEEIRGTFTGFQTYQECCKYILNDSENFLINYLASAGSLTNYDIMISAEALWTKYYVPTKYTFSKENIKILQIQKKSKHTTELGPCRGIPLVQEPSGRWRLRTAWPAASRRPYRPQTGPGSSPGTCTRAEEVFTYKSQCKMIMMTTY